MVFQEELEKSTAQAQVLLVHSPKMVFPEDKAIVERKP